MAAEAPVDDVPWVLSAAVDAAFYQAVYPELGAGGYEAVRDYATWGWRQGRDPAPWFSAAAYLADNPDVRQAGREPLEHFLTQGRLEGRAAVPSEKAEAYRLVRARGEAPPAWRLEDLLAAAPVVSAFLEPGPRPAPVPPAPPPEPDPDEAALAGPEFDADFYLRVNPDIVAAGVDPLAHFLAAGWREGRDPALWFSIRDYQEIYPDIAQAKVNPFLHYLAAGRAEGRTARNALGFRYDILAKLRPVAERTAAAARAAGAVAAQPAEVLAEAVSLSRTGLKDLHITFSHDDYPRNFGGMQLCLQREDAEFAALGRDHLHLYPSAPWLVVRTAGEPGPLGVLLNGREVGIFTAETVAQVLRATDPRRNGARSYAVHSLLGHNADETADILEAAGMKAGFFWLHDFASLCAGFHLLRNDVEDCAAPPPGSAACGICSYGEYRARHLDEHRRLFERLDLTVVSPSEPTLALWKARAEGPARKTVVLPHARLTDAGPAPVPAESGPLRIAYLGMPAAHKGWPVFRDLTIRHGSDPRYRFLHLGARPDPALALEFHEVVVTPARPRAMLETLAALEVDAVLIWPMCRETFSFTAYEAVAAGCAVITSPESGNVAAFVSENGFGLVLPDQAALSDAVASGRLEDLARGRRAPRRYELSYSGMTADLVRQRR